MNKIIRLMVATCMFVVASVSFAQENNTLWTLGKSWSNGFNALPDVSTNLDEFRTQYESNREQWDAMFKWLSIHDLQHIDAGKYSIEGTDLTVSVQDSQNQPLEKRSSESHLHIIDFQYVVKGTERFALLDHASSKPNCEYKPDVIHYDYDKSKAVFFDTTPQRFCLFFPSDWHIAKIATDKEDQNIRVIVVKLKYVETTKK